MKAIVKVDGKGRITIPLYIRESIGLEPDSYVEIEVIESGKELRLRPIAKSDEVLADLTVELHNINDLHKLIEEVVREGADIKLLKCRSLNEERYSCTITIGVIDVEMVEILRSTLSKARLPISSINIISRRPRL